GIPRTLPSLLLVHKLQRRAAGVGRAGPPPTAERIADLARLAASGAGEPGMQEAVGELLYQVVALAQQAGVDPEGALRKRANDLLDELGSLPVETATD
ncbi:MAG: nucleoside triphosphate pyrophosphohydrolase, partial [Actinomycetota bacterium]